MLSPQEQSKAQKDRNRKTLKITQVDNGYIIQKGNTGETRVAVDLADALQEARNFFTEEM